MAEYIKKEIALEILRDSADAYGTFTIERSIYLTAKQKIKNIPSADVAPVSHGKWTEVQKENIWGDIIPVFECSLCGKYTFGTKGITEKSNYCPNCGARMDEEE